MSVEERDAFLREERTCRIASVGRGGAPHISPLWFTWDGSAMWLSSIVKSQRWADLMRDPRVSIVVDAGHDFGELRGVELQGTVTVVGEVPRVGEPCDELRNTERLHGRKYRGSDEYVPDGRHAWLRMEPEKIVSWDFRKMPR
jgi:PPOX class probable F420-dependent enzyme